MPIEIQDSTIYVSHLKLEYELNNLLGYFDSIAQKEYVLIGFGPFHRRDHNTGFYIVDVSIVEFPSLVTKVTNVPGYDLKNYENFVYSVSGSEAVMGTITDISNIQAPEIAGSFEDGHNLFIREDGIMALSRLEFLALHLFNLQDDPVNPELIWLDGQRGSHDAILVDHLLIDFHGSFGTIIYDSTDLESPEIVSTINPGPDILSFHHGGWATQDLEFLIITDERADRPGFNHLPDISIWDIRNLESPSLVNTYNDSTATAHNVQTDGAMAYFSYYTTGMISLDLSNLDIFLNKRSFDTTPMLEGKGIYEDAFGVYVSPYSNIVFVSDRNNGLFVFRKN